MLLWVCRVWQTQLLTHCCLGMEFFTHINEGVDAAEFPVLREATEQGPCRGGGDFNVSQDRAAARLQQELGQRFGVWQPGVPVNTGCVPGLDGKGKQIQAARWIPLEIGCLLQTCCLWGLLNDI